MELPIRVFRAELVTFLDILSGTISGMWPMFSLYKRILGGFFATTTSNILNERAFKARNLNLETFKVPISPKNWTRATSPILALWSKKRLWCTATIAPEGQAMLPALWVVPKKSKICIVMTKSAPIWNWIQIWCWRRSTGTPELATITTWTFQPDHAWPTEVI